MKIEEHMIADKELAGTTSSGEDILGIKTHGGLYAYFLKKKSGGYQTLAMAPHKAIASWIAEQACNSRIQWHTLEKSEPKSEEEVYDLLKKSLYVQTDLAVSPSEYFIAFNHKNGEMRLTKSNELAQLKKNEGMDWTVRNAALSGPCTVVGLWEP